MNFRLLRFAAASALALAALPALALAALPALALAALPALAGTPAGAAYPYGGPAFTHFIADSDHRAGAGTPKEFYAWMDGAPLARQSHGLSALTAAERQALAHSKTPALKAAEERAFCARLHTMVKTYLPRFSLDEGFEFTNAEAKGERQCLLQSVLLAGLLQRAGVDAGAAMVWRNLHGQDTNNSHCITLVHLADGHDVELDASDPVPFVQHQGLLAEQDGLRDVEPVFAGATPTILGYKATGTGQPLATRQVRPLGVNFIRSQFDYYRGERAPGGLLAPAVTPDGLATEAKFLRAAIQADPDNALAVYMLGRVYWKQDDLAAARRQAADGLRAYAAAGWTPAGPRDFAAQVSPPSQAASVAPPAPPRP